MTARTTNPPDVGPVPDDIVNAERIDNLDSRSKVQNTEPYERIRLLNSASSQTHAPYTWGFTIYRALPLSSPGGDERFAAGVERLEAWMRYWVRQWRHELYDADADSPSWLVEWQAQPPEWHVSNHLAERLWNEVVDDYPAMDDVVSGPAVEEGMEDFSPVCRAFLDWAERNVKPENRDALHVRNDHCLVIDETVLRTLEALPSEVPEVRQLTEEEGDERFEIKYAPWVWLLDREYAEAWLRSPDGNGHLPGAHGLAEDEKPCPPWIRIHIKQLFDLWFMRPQRLTISTWNGVALRDLKKHNEVFWWKGTGASSANETMRRVRQFKREHGRAPRIFEV